MTNDAGGPTPFDPAIFVAGRMLIALGAPIPIHPPRSLTHEEQMAAMAFLVRYWLDQGVPEAASLSAAVKAGNKYNEADLDDEYAGQA